MRLLLFWLVFSALLGRVGSASAEEPSAKKAAAAHFERGLALAKNGELEAAAAEFEDAYRASPHYSVLYNLGQAYASVGKPIDAVVALEQFLREGGDRVNAQRRTDVERLLKSQRDRVARAELQVEPAGAEVLVDGKPSGTAPLDSAIELGAGTHVFAARKDGHVPAALSIELLPKETKRIVLRLEPESAEPPPPAWSSVGQLSVACDVPGVSVSIDGKLRGVTPLRAPILVPSGARGVRFTRPGYHATERIARVTPEQVHQVSCAIRPDLQNATARGALTVSSNEPRARIAVDGRAYDGGWLPAGPHDVRVEYGGFEPWTKTVEVIGGRNHHLSVKLNPTRDHLDEIAASSQRQRNWALGIGVGGVVLGGAAATLYGWNLGRYDDWSDERARVDRALGSQGMTRTLYERDKELDRRATDIQRVDTIALGTAIAGGYALVTSAVLWFTSD
jgi:hypothetical protein